MSIQYNIHIFMKRVTRLQFPLQARTEGQKCNSQNKHVSMFTLQHVNGFVESQVDGARMLGIPSGTVVLSLETGSLSRRGSEKSSLDGPVHFGSQ